MTRSDRAQLAQRLTELILHGDAHVAAECGNPRSPEAQRKSRETSDALAALFDIEAPSDAAYLHPAPDERDA